MARREFINEKNIDLLTRHGILTKEEMYSRYEINMENYAKTINIEALTMLEMAKEQILPAVLKYTKGVLKGLALKKDCGIAAEEETKYAAKLSELSEKMFVKIKALEDTLEAKDTSDIEDVYKRQEEKKMLREIDDDMMYYEFEHLHISGGFRKEYHLKQKHPLEFRDMAEVEDEYIKRFQALTINNKGG